MKDLDTSMDHPDSILWICNLLLSREKQGTAQADKKIEMTNHQIRPEIHTVQYTDLSNIIVTAPSQRVQFHQVLKVANLKNGT